MNRTILTSGAALLLAAPAALAQQGEKPNFILFLADDCSYYDIGCYGSKNSITPNIDNFAKEGMLFTEAYEAAPMSSPTRHNLFTGIWPVKSGAYPNHSYVKQGTKSIIHHLKPQGYKVALVGKLDVMPEESFPFDFYVPLKPKDVLDMAAVESFVEECTKSDTPYCLMVCSRQPHTPWASGDASLFDAEKLELPPIYVDIPETREELTRYYGEINYMDNEFGTTLSILDEKGDRDNTAVLFLSEQGNWFPFAKWTLYDAGVHSAMIMRWPGKVQAGSRSDAIVEYCDVTPTFVDMAGGELVAEVDGESFKQLLLGEKRSHKQYSFSVQTTRGIGQGSKQYGIRAVYDGKYRYIINLTTDEKFSNNMVSSPLFQLWKERGESDENAKFLTDRYVSRPAAELYDVKRDPFCLDNLADQKRYAKDIERLDKVLRNWMVSCGDEGATTELAADKHMKKALGGGKNKKQQ